MGVQRPYRVAYVIGELGQGGAEYQLHELVRFLDRERFMPRVFALNVGGQWAEAIRRLGVVVVEAPRRHSLDPRRLRALRSGLREFTPHLLHTVLWSANCYGRLAALGLGIPVRIAAERNAIRRPRWQVWVERALDRATDAYLVNCGAVATMLERHDGLPRRKMRIVPNGIDLGQIPPFSLDRRRARAALGFAPERRLVAQVGRLTPQKDYATFLQAAAQIAAETADVDFLVVGGGEQRAALEAQAERLGLARRLRFTGPRQDVPTLLGAVDVLTLTSIYEGFPNVVLEAMAAGAVTVATDVGGCGELVKAGETGLLVPVRAPTEVATAVGRVLRDPVLAERLATAARRRVEKDFTLEAMVRATVAAYETLLAGDGSRAAA